MSTIELIEVPMPLISPSLGELLNIADRECQLALPEDFFPISQATPVIEDGKRICRPCPARSACLAYALTHDVAGIWGATTHPERMALRRLHDIEDVEPVTIPAAWLARANNSPIQETDHYLAGRVWLSSGSRRWRGLG